MLYRGPLDRAPWRADRWPNFSVREIACRKGSCPHCGGEVVIGEEPLDALQRLRDLMRAPLEIVSGHRCVQHNAEVGGAVHSAHLDLAFDIALGAHERRLLFSNAQAAGFHHFGFMRFGLHVDVRAPDAAEHFWTYGPESKRLWGGIVPAGAIDIGGNRS